MSIYSCPICSSPLSQNGREFRCRAKHTFDIAKEGYVNLLPANKKRSHNPGDNGEMISARGRFLGAGYYQPLAKDLVTLVGAPHRLADLGCGQGYFTAAFCGLGQEVYGLDISKEAVRVACKQAQARFVVASTLQLPFLGEIFDAVTVIMAPTSTDIPRVLKKGALLYRVLPGENHLVELRELAYRDVWGHKLPPMKIDGLKNMGCERVTFENNLGSDALVDLIAMTPMQFRTTQEFRQQVAQLEQLCVTADFRIDLFQKD